MLEFIDLSFISSSKRCPDQRESRPRTPGHAPWAGASTIARRVADLMMDRATHERVRTRSCRQWAITTWWGGYKVSTHTASLFLVTSTICNVLVCDVFNCFSFELEWLVAKEGYWKWQHGVSFLREDVTLLIKYCCPSCFFPGCDHNSYLILTVEEINKKMLWIRLATFSKLHNICFDWKWCKPTNWLVRSQRNEKESILALLFQALMIISNAENCR